MPFLTASTGSSTTEGIEKRSGAEMHHFFCKGIGNEKINVVLRTLAGMGLG
jgi:hypothetical protein